MRAFSIWFMSCIRFIIICLPYGIACALPGFPRRRWCPGGVTQGLSPLMFAHLCSGGGIVLPSVSAVGVEHRAPFGRRRRVCLEGRFASGVSFLRRANGTDTSIVHLHLQPAPGIPFFIRGKNPTDASARAYITDNVDEEFQSYAWKIAKHETIVGLGRPVNGVITNAMCYNQFNPTGQYKELPNFGAPDGWGSGRLIAQAMNHRR